MAANFSLSQQVGGWDSSINPFMATLRLLAERDSGRHFSTQLLYEKANFRLWFWVNPPPSPYILSSKKQVHVLFGVAWYVGKYGMVGLCIVLSWGKQREDMYEDSHTLHIIVVIELTHCSYEQWRGLKSHTTVLVCWTGFKENSIMKTIARKA